MRGIGGIPSAGINREVGQNTRPEVGVGPDRAVRKCDFFDRGGPARAEAINDQHLVAVAEIQQRVQTVGPRAAHRDAGGRVVDNAQLVVRGMAPVVDDLKAVTGLVDIGVPAREA